MRKTIRPIYEEYKQLGIDQQIDYAKFYLYSIITHSTAIEGSTVTELENRLLFDEGIGAQKPLIEQMMNLDLKTAYEQGMIYARQHTDYSVDLLCSLSALVMKNTGSEYCAMAGNFSAAKGELRLLNVSAGIGGRSYLSYQKVPSRTEAFCQWLNEERRHIDPKEIEKVYDLSFEAHYRLVEIHPWADGNGRMSRLVMNMIQYEFGVIPSIVKKEKRKQYITSLEQSEKEDCSDRFKAFMLDHHCENLIKQIAEYRKSMEEDEPTISTQDVAVNVAEELTERQRVIVELIKNGVADGAALNVTINTKYLSEKLNVNRKTIQRDIAHLQERKLIQWVGSYKTGHWEIIKDE